MSDPIIVVGEKGKELRFFPNPTPAPANPVVLTGATVTLHLRAPDGTEQILSCIVHTGGDYASRFTLTTDFVQSGAYEYQVWADFGAVLLKSLPNNILVSPNV